MSEELIPPFTGLMSKETAEYRVQKAVEYYHKKLNVQKNPPELPNRDKRDKENNFKENVNGNHGKHDSKGVNNDGHHGVRRQSYVPQPERFVRGGQRATVHEVNSGTPWHSFGDGVQNQKKVVNSQEQKSRSKKQHSQGLHRSNSNLEENMEFGDKLDTSFSSRREYGSTSSLDMMNASTSSDSFFQMVGNLRPVHTDQRCPAPSKFKEVLRGSKVEEKSQLQFQRDLEQIANGSLIQNQPVHSYVHENENSPEIKVKHKQMEQKLRSKSVSQDIGSGVWKRLRGKSEIEVGAKIGDSVQEIEFKSDDRCRHKAFVHYDCQSIGFDINKVDRTQCSTFTNVATGASAASGTRESYAAEPEGTDTGSTSNLDDGDDCSNELVQSCSCFRNEIGGEAERTIGLTQTNANKHIQMTRERKTNSAIILNRSPECCGVTILDCSPTSVGHILPPHITYKGHIMEYLDTGAYYYRHFFNSQEHQNYFGIDDYFGPVAISIKREKLNERKNNLGQCDGGLYQFRVIVRTSGLTVLRGAVLEDAIPASGRLSSSRGIAAKDLLKFLIPELQATCLRQAISGQKTSDQLMKLDEQRMFNNYKIGILYCKSGQTTEEDMYNNEFSGPAFEEFLQCIGEKVRLKGFEKYRAQLDNKTDSTGTHSIYTTFNNCEIMFHVSTMLPFTPKNRQQVCRKRHIGNDIVTIVFQEPGAPPFTPKSVRSQFQHVFIIVRACNPCSDNTTYSVAVSRSKDVPPFGPTIPEKAKFHKSREFAEFLLAKVINAENAAIHSEKFAAMAVRTRQEYLKDLARNYVTSNSLESASKLSKFVGGKKNEKNRCKLFPDNFALGAIVWHILVDCVGQSTQISCFLGIAAETLVIVEESSKYVIFTIHCGSVLGWTSQALSLRLFYQQGECLVLQPVSGDMEELQEIITRLKAVTFGCETEELSLKRNGLGQLGFHIQGEGIVTEVEQFSFAYESCLKKGSRLVEICKVATVTLSHDQMVDLLRTSATVKVVVIPPLKDGSPRGVVNLHASHHYSSYPALNAVIQAEYSHHQRQARSSSTDPFLSQLPPTSPKDVPIRDRLAKSVSQISNVKELRESIHKNDHEKDIVIEKEIGNKDIEELWELREIIRKDSKESRVTTDSASELELEYLHERESSVSSTVSQASQHSSSNTLPHQKTKLPTEYRGEMKSALNQNIKVTENPHWLASSHLRGPLTNAAYSIGHHVYQDSTVSSGRGSLFDGRGDTIDHYISNSRGLDDSSYGTLEDRHKGSEKKDISDQNTFGSGKDWVNNSESEKQASLPKEISAWQESIPLSQANYLTSHTDNIITSSTASSSSSAPFHKASNPQPASDFTSIQPGNYAQELLKQIQNTKYLLRQGSESSRDKGINSVNSSSVNLSDSSLSSGSCGGLNASGMPQSGSHTQSVAFNRNSDRDVSTGRRRDNLSSSKSCTSGVNRRGVFTKSPHSSEQSSPRSSNKNLSEESQNTRLCPGVTTTYLVKSKTSNNLQDDLMRLIDPDITESDLSGLLTKRSPNRRLMRTVSDESLHNGKGSTLYDLDTRETLFIEKKHELRGSREQLKNHRSSPVALSDVARHVPMPDSASSLDWCSLVNVATQAIGSVNSDTKDRHSYRLNPTTSSSTTVANKTKDIKIESVYRQKNPDRPPDPPTASNPPVWRSVVPNPQLRIQELETKVAQLEEELAQERQESAALDSEVQRLRTENARLQEESQNAAAQLRKFTEWFFTTLDRQ